MTTAIFTTPIMTYIDDEGTAGALEMVDLRIFMESKSSTFSYSIEDLESDSFPIVSLGATLAFASMNGKSLSSISDKSTYGLNLNLGSLQWGGTSSTVLGIEFNTGAGTDNQQIVLALGGADLPFSNLAQFSAFQDNITDLGAATGVLGEGANIAWSTIPDVTFTERDVIHGTEEADVMNGGKGNDKLYGHGNADDTYDKLFGGAGNDKLFGGDGDDDMDGGIGNDRYVGGAGHDFMISSKGVDTYIGGAGTFDHIGFAIGGHSGVTANLATGEIIDQWGNHEKVSGVEVLKGTQWADSFTGNKARNDFRGLGGDDLLDGGKGIDRIRYDRDAKHGGTDGVEVNLKKGVATDGFGDTDTLISIEDVRGSDLGDKITGSNGKNTLQGYAGNDRLSGLNGDDTLLGDDGKDTLNGGNGDDHLTGGTGNDVFVFNGKFGYDVITDFSTGGTREKINLSKVSGISSFKDLVDNHLTPFEDEYGDAFIQDGAGNSIHLWGVKVDDLSSDDFVF